MKLAFFGTSDRSIPILNNLHNNFDLNICFTKPDTKVGRKQKLKETGVKRWAKKNGVDYFEISQIRKQSKDIIETLKKYKIQLGVVADFSFIIPKNIIEIPKYKLLNIHFSLLPKYRGASPVQHAILNDEKETGVTFYIMDEGMDTGPVLEQIRYKLNGDETSGNLYSILFNIAGENLPKVIEKYTSGKIEPHEQNETEATYCWSKTNPKTTYINKNDAKIGWEDSLKKIESSIRAFHPWPIAWCLIQDLENNPKLTEHIQLKENINRNKKVKIYSAYIQKDLLKIEKLQVAGKNVIDWSSFVNGYTT